MSFAYVKRRFVIDVYFMQLKRFILLLLSILWAWGASAQERGGLTQSRILVLLDESSSMLQQWSGGRPKIKVANEIILRLMDSVYSVNGQVEFSLRAFGHQHEVGEHDCTDTKNEVPFSKYNKTQMEFRLEDLKPLGVTSIAYSLSEAADKDLVDENHNAYSIVLVTDGGESCGGDICAVMAKLIRNKVYFKPYILSLEDVPELKSEYACMGDYLTVTKPSDISKAVGVIVEAFRPMLKLTKQEYKDIQIKAPSVMKVTLPTPKPKKDSVIKEIPKPKPVDTVAAPVKKEPVTSHIVVGEEVKKATPLKMQRLSGQRFKKLSTLPVSVTRPGQLAVYYPEIKVMEPDPVPVKPAAAKLSLAKVAPFKKLKTTKPGPYIPYEMAVFLPDIKVTEPEIVAVRAQPAKMTAISIRGLKKLKTTKPGPYEPYAIPVFLPEIKVMEPEVVLVKAAPAKLTAIAVRPLKKLKTQKPEPFTPPAMAVFYPEIKVDIPEVKPEKPAAAKLTALKLSPFKKMKVTKPGIYVPQDIPVFLADIRVSIPEVAPPPPKRVVERFTKLKPPAFKMHLLYSSTFFDKDTTRMKLLKIPEFKPQIATAVTPVPVKTSPIKPMPVAKTGEYSVDSREDSKETTLEVYLTNGKGKFYSTTPQVFILDPVNNSKEIKKFYRTVDATGNPDPITNLAAGKYDLTIAGRDDLLAHVDMVANRRNKVYVKVKNYSLYFYYLGAPDRPVTEFKALVIQRNTANGKQVVQKCTERLEYEPGNYHIVISTFPEDVRNVDLEAEAAGGIGIAQPGFAKFTSEVNATSAVLCKQNGDRYVSFYTLTLSDPSAQHLQMQPGLYQVTYNNGASKFSTSDRVVQFTVKSNEETQVILKK